MGKQEREVVVGKREVDSKEVGKWESGKAGKQGTGEVAGKQGGGEAGRRGSREVEK